MAPLPALVALIPGLPLTPPPPLPEPEPPLPLVRPRASDPKAEDQGNLIRINGLPQQARWERKADQLWLPLEVLEGQLGVRRSSTKGDLELEWFGARLLVPAKEQRSLGDEVAVAVQTLLDQVGVQVETRGRELRLSLPAKPMQTIRWRDQGISGKRVVFDLGGPALLRRDAGRLLIAAEASALQLEQLRGLQLEPNRQGDWISLAVPESSQLLTLAEPWRLVLDLPANADGSPPPAEAAPQKNPQLGSLMRQGLELKRQVSSIGSKQMLVNSVRLDPKQVPLDLRPLNRPEGMQGLSSLSQLARQDNAVIAVNGGFFNRVNRLPLGAMREEGRWLSGPILNRGVAGWERGELPSFDRLSLIETMEDSQGRRWTIDSVNSGYVQKGLARYTADWGNRYQPITGVEMGVLIRDGVVQQRFELGGLQGGVPLGRSDLLVVGRGGVSVPWQRGEHVSLSSRASRPVGDKANVMGGGPLLLQRGHVVLNGRSEGFSAGFTSQGAPRTVIGSDGRRLWLVTVQGLNNPGPTLMETALLMRQEGLVDALNLDGGSSTGLVLANVQTVKGRGVAASVHNGLGLSPRRNNPVLSDPRRP